MKRALNGDRLRREIMIRGYRQGSFAKAAGISQTTMSRLCRGLTADPETLKRISTTLAQLPVLELAAELVV